MAYAAVVSLMQTLQQIVDPNLHVLHRKRQIQSLQEKVSFLLDFLEMYCLYDDKVVKDLEIKIRDAAYTAEDIIESYVSTSILNRTNWIRRYLAFCLPCMSCDGGFWTFCLDLDRVIEETHSIQQEVMDVKHMLELNYVQRRCTLPVDTPTLTFNDKIPPMVGLVEDKLKIKDWITSSFSAKREIISIVGMGGIGKTTLARNLFDDPLIVYQFQFRAWVTVSQEYQLHEILVGLLDSIITLNPEIRKESTQDLAERLYKSLKGETYLIVMDDIWDTKVWDDVRRIFPDDHNGSRVVLTTRIKTVGDYAASFGHLHDMSLLSSSESWNLFRGKVFGGERCPPRLEGIGREIMRNCKGLPLSIVVVAGLLSMNKTVSYWETIATALDSILATDGGQCSKIFSLSYNHLPAQLKPCFLYFAIFPEDYAIRRSTLIQLWIAEGFIKPKESKSLEDIAEDCLEDLLNRSLIMVHKLGWDGRVNKTYRIHDLLRDFCTRESEKEKFLGVTNRHTPRHPEGIKCERRISIHPFTPSKSIEYTFYSKYGPPLQTRSIILFYEAADIIKSELRFGLLRVLDMGSGKSFVTFPMEVVRLVHLRYLSLRCDYIPGSISSIWGLQTLVIAPTRHFINLPLAIWAMSHLRHIQSRGHCNLPEPPNSSRVWCKNIVILANLQTLSKTTNFRFTDEIVERIPKLKKLGVVYDGEVEDWSQFHLDNMVCLNELESLSIESYSYIAFPPNFRFPAALKKLTLAYGYLSWKDLTMVGSLPNLEVLKLHYNACRGAVWEPKDGEFCQLKFLQLQHLDLVEWRADGSHFPQLKCLQISYCHKLKEIPMEIGNIPTLEMIQLEHSSPSTVASAQRILDEQRELGNDFLQVLIKGRPKRKQHSLLNRYVM